MRLFLETLHSRNEALFWFGLACLAGAIACLLMIRLTDTQVMGVNAWYKPLKFCLSTTLFAWAMAWYVYYLGPGLDIRLFNWVVIIMLGFEIIYIAWQAGRGQLSHYNTSTPFYSVMFSMMALAATVVSLYTAYIGLQFFIREFPELPAYYVWAIRLGLVLFVLFSLQGFMMGSQMAHTVGAADGGNGLPLVNWSTKHGDLRVAHFVGMHALQVLPLLAFFVLKDVKLVWLFSVLYGALAVWVLVQALGGRPFIRI